jgi:hypothetical protein
MLRETKFGYGFLLVGTAAPYLIDKAFGLSLAILLSVLCLIVGAVLLWSGHWQKDGVLAPFKKSRDWLVFGAALSTLTVLLTVGATRAARQREVLETPDNGIEKQRLTLEYAPVVTLIYDEKMIKVFNKGRTAINIWGLSYGKIPRELAREPRLIAPDFYYYAVPEHIEQQFRDSLQVDQEGYTPCHIYITTADSKKYTVNCWLIGKKTSSDQINIHTQTLRTVEGWTE